MPADRLAVSVEAIVREMLMKHLSDHRNDLRSSGGLEVPIGVSNRHIHLSPAAVERLFGAGYTLRKKSDLLQPGQYACEETLTLIGPRGRIDHVRILGPARGDTQVEISLYDGFTLGVNPPIRNSGDLEGTPGITLQGPRGGLMIDKGLICAARHIHMHPSDASCLGVVDGELVKVQMPGVRGLIMDHVLVRVSESYKLQMHIDLDEANAANVRNGQMGLLLRQGDSG